ncbi:hypothetical protein C2857_005696 [Epichloe festucae Fl1]|uniref:tyrosinase n=1 Tax=Epichloe festucae (strain Fl1) TaxID=877507 RepID=A0A7S9PSA8_EPIFF|nr:hypothetical protein C2857_005696 [Epichloe festucae Fl1]
MILNQVIGLLAIGLAPLAVSVESFPITGVPVEDGTAVPARKNINDLYSQGIHGLPYIEWNGGGELQTTAGWRGYCPHGENLFLPWHRAYILAFEQVLVEEAKYIAATYPPKYRVQYMEAAEQLRSPYWDWSANSNIPPCTVPMEAVVNVPDGPNLKNITIDNPLHSFRYPEKARNGEFGEFPDLSTTERCPSPYEYPESANRRLAQWKLKQDTYDIFTYSANFEEFANTHENATTLEQMHNAIHWDAGCAGQFLKAELSAFDPLLLLTNSNRSMLHHTHVDRLWAYWQFANEDHTTFTNHYYGESRYSTRRYTLIKPSSPLEPFYDGLLAYWTPNKISSIRGLGYTYEPLHYWNTSVAQLEANTAHFINTMYSDSAQQQKRRAPAEAKPRYFARLELDRAQVERPCAVRVFINGTAAGKLVVMQLPETGILRGIVAVDQEMQAAFAATSPSNGLVSSVEPLIEMDIMKPNGAIIPLSKVPSLKLTLEEVSVTPAESDIEFPTPGERKTHAVGLRDRHGDDHPRRVL